MISGNQREADRPLVAKRLFRWAHKAVLAVVDQGLISGSNFVLGVLLARWLPAQEYGAYAIAFAIFLLVSLLYQALISEPMTVFGASTFRQELRDYLRKLLRLHAAVSVVIIASLGLAALVTHLWSPHSRLVPALMAVSIASPCILLFWLARRAHYLQARTAGAAAGAAVYCLLVFGLVVLVNRVVGLSTSRAFFVLAGAALLTSVFLFASLESMPSAGQVTFGETWRRHWAYGRWALAGAVATWVPANMFYPLLGGAGGMSQAAEFKALMNFVLPVGQIAAALALLMQPHAARVFHQKGYAAVHDLTRSLVWMYPAGATVYWIVIMVLAHRIVPLLYGGNYPGVVSLIPWLAVGSVLQTATYASAVGLRAMHAPFSVFQAYGIASVVVFLVGVPAAIMFGVPGAVAGFVIGNGTAMALAYRLVLRHTSETLGQLARQEG